MRPAPSDPELATTLPGSWSIVATNFPMWVDGGRTNPRFTYGLVSADPLVLTDVVSYVDAKGAAKTINGTDVSHGSGFVWRGKGLLRLLSSRWNVTGITGDGNVAAIRFSKSRLTPAGVDVIVREGADYPDLRAKVARESADLGITAEDFATLTWI